MEICKIETNKKKYLDLLLLADEQESMIDRYLDRGDMFVMFNTDLEPVSSAVVTNEGDNVCELKSLAVSPKYQRKGYGRQMVDFLCKRYADKFKYMIVGTGETAETMSFYKKVQERLQRLCLFIRTVGSSILILFLISLLPIMIIRL